MSENELYHHGILGMKWGVRRYQYKDGSLTPAGRKKAAKMRSDYTQLTGKNLRRHPESTNGSSSSGKSKSKNDDLQTKTEELRKQREYLQTKRDVLSLQSQISAMQPQHVSAGKKFVQTYGPKMVNAAWEGVGKKTLTNYLNKKLGIETTSESERLAKRAKDAENRWKQKHYDDLLGRMSGDNKKQTNDNNSKSETNKESKSSTGETKTKNNTGQKQEKTKTYTGTVEGEGTSRYREKDNGPVYDADYREVSSGASVNRGREYVNRISMNDVFLLEDRKRKK